MAAGRVQVTFDCADPLALAAFWAAVLGYPSPRLEPAGTCRILDPDRLRPTFLFQKVPEPKLTKNRVHVDVGVASGGPAPRPAVDDEVARIVALGGHVLRPVTDDSGYFVVMADPEGNEFCVD